MRKTAMMLRRLDASFPPDLADRIRVCWRDDFLAGGYAVADETTQNAVTVARDALGLKLESTYTGKALAALLHDLAGREYDGEHYLFWNTYNSAPLPVSADRPDAAENIPQELMRYFA